MGITLLENTGMDLAKRTYALPSQTLKRFEQEIIEGCLDMWDVYRDTACDWEQIDREADRALESDASPCSGR